MKFNSRRIKKKKKEEEEEALFNRNFLKV